mgnify:CR=1 FL=1|jgi:hypothetical protein
MFGYSDAFAQSTSADVIIKDIIPPTADAGSDITASELSTILLDGTASNDGPYPITYHWRNISEFKVNILNATSATPSIIIPTTDTPRVVQFEVTVSDGTNKATDIINLTIETRPRIVISTTHYDKGTISQMNNATYTITPHPYTGADSMAIHQNMISDSQFLLEKLNSNYTSTDSFMKLYYTGDLAVDDVLPGEYTITISKHVGTLLVDSTVLHTENSHVSVAEFVSYSDIIGDIVQAISVPSPDINTNGTSTIVKLNMTVGNDTMSSLPSITLITNSTQKVSTETITISSGLSKVTNSTIPKGNDIMKILSIPTYTLPAISDVTSILPPISISNNNTNVIMSPPVKSWVAGQQIVIPVSSSNTAQNNAAAVSEIRFASLDNSDGGTTEWIGVQINNSIPDELGLIPNSDDSLFLDVKYPYEEGLGGVDWSKPANHHNTPQITINVPKPVESYSMGKTASGCAVYDVYLHDGNIWSQNFGAVILSNTLMDSDTCKVVISFEHFSSYGLSPASSSVSSGTSVSSSNSASGSSGGGGRTGVNVGSSSIGSPTSAEAITRMQEIKDATTQNDNTTVQSEITKSDGINPEQTLNDYEDIVGISLKQQISNGVSYDSVVCSNGLKIIFKLSDDSPACVKEQSIPKLVERGWARYG